MSRHPRRLVRRNRGCLAWFVAFALAGALWAGAFPSCASEMRENWSTTR